MPSSTVDPWELDPVSGHTLDEADSSHVAALLPLSGNPTERGITTRAGELTIAGALCTAGIDDPALPVLCMEYRRFPSGKGECDEIGLRPVESFTVPGPADDAIRERADDLVLSAPRQPHDRGTARRIFTELLANALGHRSFAPEHRDRAVRIDAYTDRTLIESPGPLTAEVTLDDGRPRGRRSRNPRLMALLGALGLTNQQGRGVAWARRLAPELGYRVRWTADDRSVVVHLEVDPELVTRPASPGGGREPRRRAPADLLEERIKEILRTQGPCSRGDLQRQLDSSTSKLRGILEQMVEAGVVCRTEAALRSPHQRYYLRR